MTDEVKRLTRIIEHDGGRYVNINDLRQALDSVFKYVIVNNVTTTDVDMLHSMIECCDFMNEPDGDFDFKLE